MNEGDRDAPTEFELMAYVDGELDPLQKLEIEDRLARPAACDLTAQRLRHNQPVSGDGGDSFDL